MFIIAKIKYINKKNEIKNLKPTSNNSNIISNNKFIVEKIYKI